MSFSADAKIEITQKKVADKSAFLAICYAIALFAKSYDERGLVLQTECEEVATYAYKMFLRQGIEGNIKAISRGFEFSITQAEQVQKMLELLKYTKNEPNLRINSNFIETLNAVRAFVGAAFLCVGTMTDPHKLYNLEFISPRYHLARDFEGLLAQHEFSPHRTLRRGVHVIYIKASGKIEDLLTFMGASNASLAIMEQKVYKSIRNTSNRRANCDTANLSKTVNANLQTRRAIEALQKADMIKTLPEALQQAAKLRLEYPDESLAQLAEHFTPPISKSGLSHRLKKLEALANNLQT